MKLLSCCISISILLFFGSNLYAAINVKMYTGDVKLLRKSSDKWVKISKMARLIEGDTVKTGSKSYLEIDFHGDYIKVQANSKFKISKKIIDEERSSVVSMFFGNILLKIRKLTKSESGFSVDTPSSICAVRGTEFRVASGYDGETVVQVYKGSVTFAGNQKEVLVKANQESSVEMGGEPTKVTIIKRKKWKEWLIRSRQNLKGKEEKILWVCYNKMDTLDMEIVLLEEQMGNLQLLKKDYRDKALEFKKKNDEERLKEYARKAHISGMSGNIAAVKINYKADKIELVYSIAKEAYESIDVKTKDVEKLYQKILKIFQKHNTRILLLKKDAEKRRKEIEEYKKKESEKKKKKRK